MLQHNKIDPLQCRKGHGGFGSSMLNSTAGFKTQFLRDVRQSNHEQRSLKKIKAYRYKTIKNKMEIKASDLNTAKTDMEVGLPLEKSGFSVSL